MVTRILERYENWDGSCFYLVKHYLFGIIPWGYESRTTLLPPDAMPSTHILKFSSLDEVHKYFDKKESKEKYPKLTGVYNYDANMRAVELKNHLEERNEKEK